MPASHERVPNKALSGAELKEIIKKEVAKILDRDGMYSNNLAYGRVSFEVRVSLHLDNPRYPLHISEVLSRPASKQEVETEPDLAALISPPLEDESDDAVIVSTEEQVAIASPNVARIENDMPLTITTKDMDTGFPKEVQQKFKGSIPDPAEVGNVRKTVDSTQDQKNKWRKK